MLEVSLVKLLSDALTRRDIKEQNAFFTKGFITNKVSSSAAPNRTFPFENPRSELI
jgi:hypothetical protein